MLDDLKYFGMGASWGGFESLILRTNPAAIRVATKDQWENAGPTHRIHAGLEDTEDLIADLDEGSRASMRTSDVMTEIIPKNIRSSVADV